MLSIRTQDSSEDQGEPVCNTLWKERRMTVEERWEDSRFDQMCIDWKLTEEDRAKMLEMKTRLQDVDHWKNDPYIVARFYSEFHGHLPKVEKLFRHMIEWRLTNDIDSHLDRYGQPRHLFHLYPIGVLEGCDKDGDAIYVDRVGMGDPSGLYKHFSLEGMLDYLIFLNEYINTRPFWESWEQKNGRHVTKFTVVIDLDGLNFSHIRPGCLKVFEKISRITQGMFVFVCVGGCLCVIVICFSFMIPPPALHRLLSWLGQTHHHGECTLGLQVHLGRGEIRD